MALTNWDAAADAPARVYRRVLAAVARAAEPVSDRGRARRRRSTYVELRMPAPWR